MKHIVTLLALVANCLSLGVQAQAQSGNASPSEYVVKAGFIYNFAKFVEWPAGLYPRPDSPIVLGVLGNDDFADVLAQVVAGKAIDGRPLLVKSLDWGRELRECNVLFIASDSGYGEELIQLLKGTSILTIAETSGFAERGGMINLTLEDSKVRLEVNVEAANQARLNISSRLLSLARIVQ